MRGSSLRLCYIASGTSIHTERWVNYFAQRGHEVHLISSRFTEGYEGFDSSIQMHPLVRLLPQIWKLSGYLSGIVWLLQVRRLVKRIEPDVLDAHYVGVPAYLGIASGFHPLVLTAWGSDVLIDPKRNPLRRFLTRQALRRADHIICVSSALKEETIKLGSAPNRIAVIPMGIDTQKFSPGPRNEVLLQELGIGDSPVVISTRVLRPVYDVETLIRAIPLVLSEVPQAKFIIGGDGDQRHYLENLANTLGISASVRFTGWIPHDELPKYLTSSDVYVSTSLSDSLAVSTLEARACGLPAVVGDLPATREWIADGEDGFVVPLRDPQALAERIVPLLDDESLRKKFGDAGRSIVMEKAEHEEQMTEVEIIYEELKCPKS